MAMKKGGGGAGNVTTLMHKTPACEKVEISS